MSAAVEAFHDTIVPRLAADDMETLVQRFAAMAYSDYRACLLPAARHRQLTERQLAAVVGFKDEYFTGRVCELAIAEAGGGNEWSVDKITSHQDPRMVVRHHDFNGSRHGVHLGGDCVLFRRNRPRVVVECKEYVDTIRLKELIGEAYLWKADIQGTERHGVCPKFVVFANVYELKDDWRELVQSGRMRGEIDEIFVVRQGKRKDRDLRPSIEVLNAFVEYIRGVVRHG